MAVLKNHKKSPRVKTRTPIKEIPAPIPPLTSTQPIPYEESPQNSGKNPVTRHTSRPCLCGMYGPGGCKWHFFYPFHMIIAIHEILPFKEAFGRSLINGVLGPPTPSLSEPNPKSLTASQKETFFMTPSRTNKDPTFAIIKTFAFSHEDSGDPGPWVENRDDNQICAGCGWEYDSATWVDHRDSCLGIEDAILRSLVDVWEIEARAKTQS
ncbi:uncharacterized protein EV420DRAFT_1645152 [Desarmillaria tabescens]|uniref:Uncharacterized protein n=1 Tax=Armillaria tabescens TaxID=1929756 RepID=A0AA39N1Z6_ARMTA|nr:uncharacterized protein EV420DRAFT_1645152 [Desarmillaria tabescens]KAK0454250.1 hypothetical protein EV420DRAFT_1645152 [Desarmillaria tabescens]